MYHVQLAVPNTQILFYIHKQTELEKSNNISVKRSSKKNILTKNEQFSKRNIQQPSTNDHSAGPVNFSNKLDW